MRTKRTAWTALLFAVAFGVAAAAQPPAPALVQPALNAAVGIGVGVHGRIGTVGVDFFYSNLAPYGYWVQRPSYGWVWTPRHLRHHWRPYSSGRWVYTDYGWTWVSDEPYGWATYHYGRWYNDPDYGWGWVPGTDWGPAWVSWRQGGDYVGWAALPPEVGWNAGIGLETGGFDLNVGIDPGSYCFVPHQHFLDTNVATYVGSPAQNVTIINNTTNITNYTVAGGRVINQGWPRERVQQVTGQPVRQFQLAAASDPRTMRVSGNTVALFRPAAVVRNPNGPDPSRVAPRSVLTGRPAQQLAQQRRPLAAEFRQAAAQQQGGAPGARAMASRQGAQAPAGRNQQPQAQIGRRSANQQGQQAQVGRGSAYQQRQQQAMARRQAGPAGRYQQQQPQLRRQASPSTRSQRQQQVGRQPSTAPRSQQRRSQPPSATRGQGYQSPSRASRQSMAPQRQQQAQIRRQPAQPQQHQVSRQPAPQQQFRRQPSGPPPQQRQPQVQRQAPPPRPAQIQRQAPQPQPQARRQAGPAPQRQAAPNPQRQRRQPPPAAGGPGGR